MNISRGGIQAKAYDPNHLILGDRYEANALIAMEVVEAADVSVFACADVRSCTVILCLGM